MIVNTSYHVHHDLGAVSGIDTIAEAWDIYYRLGNSGRTPKFPERPGDPCSDYDAVYWQRNH